MSADDAEIVDHALGSRRVQLLRFPLRVFCRADEHHAELMREFALLSLSMQAADADHQVPARLLALVEALTQEYASVNTAPDKVRDAALADGASSVDLDYEVPLSARDAVLRLDGLLDEADAFCRVGDRLLTLAASAETLAFRRWYLGEFVRQLDGGAPEPWPGELD